ncbi:hypothetical protein TYRP_020342 [Tyrophagus putrescentiae]|nr:hypothetical protein TYRP_020206 [Tyrophagus putrescentiae]KAH9395927.1 hypothetical protein TYRP_020342 [Tyrophagus putrescentiae]
MLRTSPQLAWSRDTVADGPDKYQLLGRCWAGRWCDARWQGRGSLSLRNASTPAVSLRSPPSEALFRAINGLTALHRPADARPQAAAWPSGARPS